MKNMFKAFVFCLILSGAILFLASLTQTTALSFFGVVSLMAVYKQINEEDKNS